MAESPLLLFFGEDSNDTSSLIHLSEALLPSTFSIDTKALRRPPILRRETNAKKKRQIADEIAVFSKVFEKRRDTVIVVAHRDCDQCEDAHVNNAEALEAELKAAGVAKPIAAVPAWELETWLMLFPAEIAEARSCWRKVNFSNRNVGSIENSKEALRRALRPTGRGHSCPDYTESDSVKIFSLVSKNRAADDGNALKSNSLKRYREKLLEAVDLPEVA